MNITTPIKSQIIIGNLLNPSTPLPPKLSETTIELFGKYFPLYTDKSEVLRSAMMSIPNDNKTLQQKIATAIKVRCMALFFTGLAGCMIFAAITQPNLAFLVIAIGASLGFITSSCWAGYNFVTIRKLKKIIEYKTEQLPQLLEDYKKSNDKIVKNKQEGNKYNSITSDLSRNREKYNQAKTEFNQLCIFCEYHS